MDDRAGVEVLVGGKACASVRRMRSRSLVCTTPPGVGRELRVLVQVRVPPYELWCVCVCVFVCERQSATKSQKEIPTTM